MTDRGTHPIAALGAALRQALEAELDRLDGADLSRLLAATGPTQAGDRASMASRAGFFSFTARRRAGGAEEEASPARDQEA
jgi:hypothetical protein